MERTSLEGMQHGYQLYFYQDIARWVEMSLYEKLKKRNYGKTIHLYGECIDGSIKCLLHDNCWLKKRAVGQMTLNESM